MEIKKYINENDWDDILGQAGKNIESKLAYNEEQKKVYIKTQKNKYTIESYIKQLKTNVKAFLVRIMNLREKLKGFCFCVNYYDLLEPINRNDLDLQFLERFIDTKKWQLKIGAKNANTKNTVDVNICLYEIRLIIEEIKILERRAKRDDYNIFEIMNDKKGNEECSNIDHPAHYNHGEFETIDKIKMLLSHDEYIGFLKGNAIKYKDRADYKGHKEEDLKKADWYLEKLKEETE